MIFDILYQDDDIIVINKPTSILVHRTKISEDRIFVVQELNKQLGGVKVNPVHRLDRPTSGVLVFAFHTESASKLCESFRESTIKKKYLALTRGHMEKEVSVDSPLMHKNKVDELECRTDFKALKHYTIPYNIGKYEQTRLSLVEASPHTGRTHQIRRHLNHIFFPIVCDRKHGDNKLNKLFKEEFELPRLMLHASEITFPHPSTGKFMTIKAPFPENWNDTMAVVEEKSIQTTVIDHS